MKLKRQVLPFLPGEEFDPVKDTYDVEICDVCGKKRKCDFWINDRFEGFDCCRTCAKEVLE